MGPLFVKGLAIGAGRPKVCVPLVGAARGEVLELAHAAAGDPACELVEWRVDSLEACDDTAAVCEMLAELGQILAAKPLLVTVRTAAEGGGYVGSEAKYLRLLTAIAESPEADLVDLELARCLDAREAVGSLHDAGAYVVGSWHDFKNTPDVKAIFRHFQEMEEAGCDILKVACMAHAGRDTAFMRAAAMRATTMLSAPHVAISMGEAGQSSRTQAASFGSCISFGTLGAASAPGQIPAAELKALLEEEG